jgi:hypothetical protein
VGLVVVCFVVGSAVPAVAAGPAYNHWCRWWNDWCNQPTTTTTTTATTTTTTTVPPTTTTTKPRPTTTTTAPTTTTSPPATTTTVPAVQASPPRPTTSTSTTSTSTTLATTTTTSAEAVGFFADFEAPRGPGLPLTSSEEAAPTPVQLLVTLAAGFVGMTIQGLGYYLFIFLLPITIAIWLGVARRRESPAFGEIEPSGEEGSSDS